MSEVKLYLFSDPNQKGKGVGLNDSNELEFTTTETLPPETAPDGSVTTTSMTSTSKITVGLLKLNYIKKMYKPGVIFATLSVSTIKSDTPVIKTEKKDKDGNVTTSTENGRATGFTRPVSRDNIKQLLLNAKAELEIDGKVVATNYFVYKVRSVHKKNSFSDVTVELTIFSEDKLLTLEKYSKAYTAKKLGTDIFKNEIGNYNLTGDATNPAYSINLQLLTYDNDKSELRQPYLVQYNESLYDFLKRTANRCGEFLYHEDGKLHLGVALNRLDLDTKDKDGNITAWAIDYADIARERYYESLYDGAVFKGDASVEDYAYNYLDNTDKNAEHHAKSDNGKFHYNDPLTTDEYLGDIGKHYTSYGDEWDEAEKVAMSQILVALSGTSFSEIVSNFAIEMAANVVSAAVNEGSKNDDNKEANITPWMDENDEDKVKAGTEDQWDGTETLRQFGTYGNKKSRISETDINMTAEFYSLVRKAEREVGEEAVWLEFGEDAQNLKLGDVIKVEGTSYLVIKISGKYEYVSETQTTMSQEVVAIPLYTVPSKSTSSTTTNVIAIPWALPEVLVREAHPQLAFVVENFDPKKIGRVRIRFAWQEKDADVSPWIRVALPFATNGGGIKFKPEKGDEVLVNFEDGNMERPYVSGYLLSERSNESWGSLSDRVIMSKNGHGITFTDGAGSDFFYKTIWPVLGVIRSWFPTSVWPDTLEDSATCAALSGGIKLSDQYGLYEISASSDERSVKIQSAMGDVTLNAFTGITISAPNGNISISGKNVEISASNNVKITSGKGINDRFFPGINSTGSFWKDIGFRAANTGIATVIDTLGVFANKFVDNFLDFSLIRTVVEIVLRPIDGTTSIKSHTFIQMEAGKGSVEFPKGQLKRAPGDPATFTDIIATLTSIPATVDDKVLAINNATTALKACIEAYNAISGEGEEIVNKSEQCIKFDAIKGKGWKATADTLKDTDNDFTWPATLKDEDLTKEDDDTLLQLVAGETGFLEKPKDSDSCYKKDAKPKRDCQKDLDDWNNSLANYLVVLNKPIVKRNNLKADKRKSLVDCANNLAKAFSDLYNVFDGIDNLAALTSVPNMTITDKNKPKGVASVKEYKNFITAADSALFDKLVNNKVVKDTDLTQLLGDDVKKRWKRKAIHHFMNQVWNDVNAEFKDSIAMVAPIAPQDVMDDAQWKAAVNSWFFDVQPVTDAKTQIGGFAKEKLVSLKDHWKEEFIDPWIDATYNRRRWQTGVQGKILLSDSPGTTISFEKDGSTYKQVNALASNKGIFELRDYLKTF